MKIMVCPDIMYVIRERKTNQLQTEFQPFARKYSTYQIKHWSGNVISYNSSQLKSGCSFVKGAVLSPNCLKVSMYLLTEFYHLSVIIFDNFIENSIKRIYFKCFSKELKDTLVRILEACEITNTVCQLQEGSLLGAVKLENILPWERDCDIAVLSSQFNNLTDYLEKNPIEKLKISKYFTFLFLFLRRYLDKTV